MDVPGGYFRNPGVVKLVMGLYHGNPRVVKLMIKLHQGYSNRKQEVSQDLEVSNLALSRESQGGGVYDGSSRWESHRKQG